MSSSELVATHGEFRADIVQLEAALKHERALAEEKLQAVQQANEELSQAFKALSADALQANNAQFLELAKAAFGELQTQARGDLDARQQAFAQMFRAGRAVADQGRQHARAARARPPRGAGGTAAAPRLNRRGPGQATPRDGRWCQPCVNRTRVAAGARCSCAGSSR
jgi:hypothetical protein